MATMAPVSSRPRLCIASPASEAEWADAARLIAEHIAWLADALALDARAVQHDANDELDALQTFYSEPSGRLLLGYVDGKPSGTVGIFRMDAETAELRRVWVTPSGRGNGLAPVMLQAAIDSARDMGARRLWLETASGFMDTAIAMYTRAGFREIPDYSTLRQAVPTLVTLGLELS